MNKFSSRETARLELLMADGLPVYYVDSIPLFLGDISGRTQSLRLTSSIENNWKNHWDESERKLFCYTDMTLDFEVPVNEDLTYTNFFVKYDQQSLIEISYFGIENFLLDSSMDLCDQFISNINNYVDIEFLLSKVIKDQELDSSMEEKSQAVSGPFDPAPESAAIEKTETPAKASSGITQYFELPKLSHDPNISLPQFAQSHSDTIEKDILNDPETIPEARTGICQRMRSIFSYPYKSRYSHATIQPSADPVLIQPVAPAPAVPAPVDPEITHQQLLDTFFTKPLPDIPDSPYFHIHLDTVHIIATDLGQMESDESGIFMKTMNCYFKTKQKNFTINQEIRLYETPKIVDIINRDCMVSQVFEDCNFLPLKATFLDKSGSLVGQTRQSLVIKLLLNGPKIKINDKAIIRWSKNTTQLTRIVQKFELNASRMCRLLVDELIAFHAIYLIIN
jgi:hypothetical protein